MNDYKLTRHFSGIIIDSFSSMIRNLEDDLEEELVICSLVKYYNLCNKHQKIDHANEWIEPDKDLLWAIERVLQDYMTTAQFNKWVATRKPSK